MRESIKEVIKTWGRELIIVNTDEYCGKLLCIDKGGQSSYHYHRRKKETFFGLSGQTRLTVEGREYMLNPFARPKTIKPGQLHMFTGITDAVLVEISTPHDDSDVVRETESREGDNGMVKSG